MRGFISIPWPIDLPCEMTELRKKLDSAAEQTSEQAVESIYREVVIGETSNDAEFVKVKEEALQKLCDIKVKRKDAIGLRQLLTELRPLFTKFPKAKTAKMVRNLIDAISRVPDSTELQVEPASIHWPRHLFLDLTGEANICRFRCEALDSHPS